MLDEADVAAHRTLTEKYLKRFGTFLNEHSTQLINVLADKRISESGGALPNVTGGIKAADIVTAFPVTHSIWNFTSDPIQVTWVPLPETSSYEELITIPLPPDGNPDVQKVMLVLVTLTSQMRELREKGWTTYTDQLILYGDGFESDSSSAASSSVTEGEGLVAISKFLPILYDLVDFLRNCRILIAHCVQQLGALFKDSKPHVVSITNIYIPSLLRELAALLTLLIIMDEIVGSQSVLQEHWTKYRQMIKSVRADSGSFGVDSPNKLLKLEKDLILLDREVLNGHSFRNLIDQLSQQVGKSVGRNVSLSERFVHYLTMTANSIEKDFSEGDDDLKPIGLAALYIFVSTLFPSTFDSKKLFYKVVWEGLKKIPGVPIAGSLLWTPEVFLNSFKVLSTKFFDVKALQSFSSNRHNYLQQKVTGLPKDVMNYHLQVCSWSVRLQENLCAKDISNPRQDDLTKKYSILIQGIKLCQLLSQHFRLLINLHATLGRPVTKQVVRLLCQILELLKLIQSVFFRFSVHICSSSMFIMQTVMHTALTNIQAAQKALNTMDSSKKMDEVRSDSLSVLIIMENALKGPPSKRRLLVSKITLDWAAASSRLWKDEEAHGVLVEALDRISHLVEMDEKISELCNGSTVYWHRIILSTYFSCIYGNELEAAKLPLIFLVLQDCLDMLEKSPHKEQAKKSFVFEIEAYLKAQLVEKLCQDVETDLRLLSHSHLQVQSGESSPFRLGVKEYKCLLETPSLLFNNRKINFKYITEYYLSKTFYNLASVALHDWQSYATMRVLASDKYQLEILEDHLPGHTLEQGLDILEIVRNLNRFVVEFTYNLNNQVFVQVSSPNKHLDTVNIRHLANSMRTHGPGMANTTVNFTYHFLRSKIHSFSQFLYDEQIKSRLAKDIRLFKQGRQDNSSNSSQQSVQNSFPYDRAQKFQRGIRKLGLTPDGLSPLDQFRLLITHIGNALGFVRLVRSGGLHFLAGGCRFVPDLEDIPDFGEMIRAAGEDPFWNDELKAAVSGVESSLKILTSSFSGGVDYFKLLVSAFQAACRDSRNSHFRNFYVIIPALTLSYVDHMRSCKDRLAKKSKSTTIFTDDGFPMGVAYLLKVVGQDSDFDSLGWFSGVKQRLTDERKLALQTISDSKKDEKLQQANTLTAKRVQDFLQEFDLLRYNLSSARIFFQQSDTIVAAANKHTTAVASESTPTTSTSAT